MSTYMVFFAFFNSDKIRLLIVCQNDKCIAVIPDNKLKTPY